MTYYNITFEQFFNGRDLSKGLQLLDHRHTTKQEAVEIAAFWKTQFPNAKIKVQKITVEDLEEL